MQTSPGTDSPGGLPSKYADHTPQPLWIHTPRSDGPERPGYFCPADWKRDSHSVNPATNLTSVLFVPPSPLNNVGVKHADAGGGPTEKSIRAHSISPQHCFGGRGAATGETEVKFVAGRMEFLPVPPAHRTHNEKKRSYPCGTWTPIVYSFPLRVGGSVAGPSIQAPCFINFCGPRCMTPKPKGER